jgi:hypothetical protein
MNSRKASGVPCATFWKGALAISALPGARKSECPWQDLRRLCVLDPLLCAAFALFCRPLLWQAFLARSATRRGSLTLPLSKPFLGGFASDENPAAYPDEGWGVIPFDQLVDEAFGDAEHVGELGERNGCTHNATPLRDATSLLLAISFLHER